MPESDPAKRIRLGLIGAGIGASLTPSRHEREGGEQGLAITYERIDIDAMKVGTDALPRLLDAAEAAGFAGVNITHPFKQAVMPLLHRLSPEAVDIGAVNTVVFHGGQRTGHNTDWSGFFNAFTTGLPGVKKDRVVLIGAGGGGSAVAHAAMKLGVGTLEIADADCSKAEGLARTLVQKYGNGRAVAATDLAASIPRADGLIHATPTGMELHPGLPINPALLRQGLWVSDIIYFPAETALLSHARALGCKTMNGGPMAVYQAVDAFRLFTGVTADPARMARHFESMVSSK